MTVTTPLARATITADPDWRVALERGLTSLAGVRPDALFIFASNQHAAHFTDLLEVAWRTTRAPIVLGCSGAGIIGMERELEGQPAISLLALSLPDGKLSSARIGQSLLDMSPDGSGWPARLGIAREDVNGWLIFADPFRVDGEALLTGLEGAYPGTRIVGGFASPGPEDRRTWVFLNGEIYADGAVALGIGGNYELIPVVSQGCDPIGQAWTITSVQSHWIETISNRPAVQVLAETLNGLPQEIRLRAQRNLLAGIAADEYRHEFLRGDFLIRNIIGIDQLSGAVAVASMPRVGQTIQFQMRDAVTADLDLNLMLDQARLKIGPRQTVAAVLCACNGRGANLFGMPHHDANAIARKLRDIPLAGLFCAGELGPVGTKTFVHAFTASLGVIVRTY